MDTAHKLLFSLAFLATACGPTPSVDHDASTPDAGSELPQDAGSDAGRDAGSEPPDGGPAACEAHVVACAEQAFTDMAPLFEEPAPSGLVTEESVDDGAHVTLVDATGMPSAGTTPTTSYVYARFTDAGLEQVAVSDEEAFESTDWDIAFRRYVIRLNGGVSGPSCVRGARLPPGDDGSPPVFDEVTEIPDALPLSEESYFTEADGTCTFVNDGSGLPGAADSVLASYWSYAGCLAMTDHVYAIELRDGRRVKLQLLSYYTPENQETCDTTGSVPSPSGAAHFRVRWAFFE